MQNSQRQIYQQQIDLLRTQIDQQNKREQKLRSLIDTLTEQMQYMRETQEENYRLTQLNQRLMEGVKDAKNRHGEEIRYYDEEIGRLKGEILERGNQVERLRVEFQKRELIHEEKIAMLESIIEKKCHKMSNLQKKLHDESISKLKQSSQNQVLTHSRISRSQKQQDRNSSELGLSTLRVSHIDNYDSENNMRASNISTISRKSRAADYLYMDKSQMKVMMGALIKSKREIEKGNIKSTEGNQYQHNRTMM